MRRNMFDENELLGTPAKKETAKGPETIKTNRLYAVTAARRLRTYQCDSTDCPDNAEFVVSTISTVTNTESLEPGHNDERYCLYHTCLRMGVSTASLYKIEYDDRKEL